MKTNEQVEDKINRLLSEKGFQTISDISDYFSFLDDVEWRAIDYLLSFEDKEIERFLFVRHFIRWSIRDLDESVAKEVGPFAGKFIRKVKQYDKKIQHFDDIYTERLRLTRPTKRDAKEFCKHLKGDGDFMLYIGAEYSEFEANGQAEMLLNDRHNYSIKLKSGEMVGVVELKIGQFGIADLSYYTFKQKRLNGYCREACQALIDQAFAGNLYEIVEKEDNGNLTTIKHYIDVTTIKARCFTFNEGSDQTLKALGFTYSGFEYQSYRLGNGELASENLYFLSRDSFRNESHGS